MKLSLIATKTFLPPTPEYQVPRARLEALLDAAVRSRHRLILISAAPGSGKSSLVSAWAARQDVRLAWVSLEAGDNDPIRFWSYFLAAIRASFSPQAGTMLEDLNEAPELSPVFLPELVNLLASRPEPLVVALDDYHVIENPEIHQGILYLLEHLPAQACLAILTRIDPPLPIHRWRARGQMTEIRAAALRFTPEEAGQFLNGSMGLGLQPEDIQRLEERTEGWATGLQLAALSMQGRGDRREFIQQFTGSHHFILEYLMNEVFARQTAEVQRFLLLTSVLETFHAGLCDWLSGGEPPGAAVLLSTLERANLFLVPLDEEHTWFRYHHLFSTFLYQRLKRQGEEELRRLHRRAAEWYGANARVDEALRHALAAQDYPFAFGIIHQYAMAAASDGLGREVVGWLEALPQEQLAQDFQMTLLYAWMLISIGKTNSLGPLLSNAERWLASASAERMTEAERQASLGHLAALQAMQTARVGNTEAAGRYVADALRFSSPENAPSRGLAWLAQANLKRYVGSFKEAIPAYMEALVLMPSTGAFSGTCNVIVALGQVYLAQGQLAAAEDVYRSNLAAISGTGRAKSPAVGILQCGLAEVMYEQDRLAEARSLFNDSEANSRRCGMIDLLTGVAILGARLTRSAGDLPGAIRRLAEAQTLFRPGDSPNLHAEINAWLARFQAEAGDLAEAGAWAGGVRPCPEHNPGYTQGVELFSLGRVLLCQGRLEEAFQLAAKLEDLAAQEDSHSRVIEARLLQAEILWMQDQRPAGLGKLGEGLELAESCGLRRLFLDEGPRLAPLLAAWSRNASPGQSVPPSEGRRGGLPRLPQQGLASRLLERFRAESRLEGMAETAPAEAAASDLTGREMDVLRGLIAGLSYAEIADRLVISAGTVKTHVSHIYAKLGVEGRIEAIRRAQELKIA